MGLEKFQTLKIWTYTAGSLGVVEAISGVMEEGAGGGVSKSTGCHWHFPCTLAYRAC